MSRTEVKKMLLRCVIRKEGILHVGTCLELGLSARGENVPECKRALLDMIDSHVKTVFELHKNGEKVIRTPVKYYLFKKLTFDCIYSCTAKRPSNNTERPKYTFTERVWVPA